MKSNLNKVYQKRNKILIVRDKGGLGDIFMHRMLFEDIKTLMPDSNITFLCPSQYHEALYDHPYIDHIVSEANPEDFGIVYNTSNICNEYEMSKAPYVDKHRSDIWAEHCGFTLTKHNMHFGILEEEKQWAETTLERIKPPRIAFAPISAMQGKNLDETQIQPILDAFRGHIFILHNKPLNYDVPQFNLPIRKFISLVNASELIISVDSAALHCAGGLNKKVVGIFSWADGKIYGRYYHDFHLIQKHRDNGNWDCGPCYNFFKCPKLPEIRKLRKPCITEITADEIIEAVNHCL